MRKEYRIAGLRADIVSDTFNGTTALKATGWISVRRLFDTKLGYHRTSRSVLREWLDASGFAHAGTMPLTQRLLEVEYWAEGQKLGPWVAYTETEEEEGRNHVTQFYFQRWASGSAFKHWLAHGPSFAHRLNLHVLRQSSLAP